MGVFVIIAFCDFDSLVYEITPTLKHTQAVAPDLRRAWASCFLVLRTVMAPSSSGFFTLSSCETAIASA